jgi:hypothetical protein
MQCFILGKKMPNFSKKMGWSPVSLDFKGEI